MSSQSTPAEILAMHRRAALAGAARALGLLKRTPELMRARGWPIEDEDLKAVLMAAVACHALGARAQIFRRPAGADQLKGLWPAELKLTTAKQIVDTLELDELLHETPTNTIEKWLKK